MAEDNDKALETLKHVLSKFPQQGSSFLEELMSHLGRLNPLSGPVDPSSTILWLLDNTAYHPKGSSTSYQIDLVAAYFVRRSGDEPSQVVAELARVLDLADDKDVEETIARRMVPLLNHILPGRTVRVAVAGQEEELGPSSANGVSKTKIILPNGPWQEGQIVETKALEIPEAVYAHTTFAGSTGWAVVSDIDDSIKKTLTNEPLGLLRTTFVDEPEPIAGMPELYTKMQSKLGSPAWWYLSGSPYNLYPFLRAFLNKHYPLGTILLRDSSWENLLGFLASLANGIQEFKEGHLEDIHECWPNRMVICIGDSTQKDPESYAEIFRLHPGWIKAIWIRRVHHVAEVGDYAGHDQETRNKPERFEKAFKGVPTDVWHVFDDPRELYTKLEDLD